MDTLGLYDIYGFYYVPFWKTSLFFYSISGIVCIGVGLITYVLYCRFQKRSYDPWKILDQRIVALRNSPKPGTMKWYGELTAIVKDACVMGRYDMCRGMTDMELANFIVQMEPLREELVQLVALLRAAVQYKFDPTSRSKEIGEQQCALVEAAIVFLKQDLQTPGRS
jgi:hypothetical protein